MSGCLKLCKLNNSISNVQLITFGHKKSVSGHQPFLNFFPNLNLAIRLLKYLCLKDFFQILKDKTVQNV